MDPRTLKELRALAKARGLKGYSKLTKDELLELLARETGTTPRTGATLSTNSGKKALAEKTAMKTVVRPAGSEPRARSAPAPAAVTPPATTTGYRVNQDEERVERAKFAMVPPGVGFVEPRFTAELGEDIDRLPSIAEPMLCLLPQKPGILHGYWQLRPGTVPSAHPLKLRLGRIAGETFEILEEIPVPHAYGQWYFHLDESADHGAIYLQLGYYEPGGRFVTAFHRAIARIPSLYASDRTDRLWWISDAQFRAMYLRAGGFVRGAHLGWAASIGSPFGAPAAGPERFVWPGGVSSQR